MKRFYTIANNTLSINHPDGLPAWGLLDARFAPFATPATESADLDVSVTVGAVVESDAEAIYEPDHAGIGFVTSRACRLSDGSLVMEFKHIKESALRLSMTMSSDLCKADITLAPDGDGCDPYFLGHALMIAYMMATCDNGTLMFHSAAVMVDGMAYLFQGRSGTGKSTHARLWIEHIAGAELLNDDHPLVRILPDGTAMAYGSPWSGKTDCYRNESARVGGFVRIVRAEENEFRPLKPLQAYASLTSSVFFLPFLTDSQRATRHAVIERLAMTIPVGEMHCLPNASAALTCAAALR